MTKRITVAALAVLMFALALPASAQIQATSVDIRGEVFDNSSTPHVPHAVNQTGEDASWNANNFAGFWYDLKNGLMSENMVITDISADDRTINQKGIWYNTTKQIIQYKVNEANGSNLVEQGYNAAGQKVAAGGGYYYKIGWQAEQYVALNGKATKLAKLVIEQGTSTSEKKTLQVGESWDVGSGWTLTANSIDAKASPRQVWLTLSKDGVKKDDKIAYQGTVYTFTEKSIGGESDTPVFVTYIDSIFAGATSDIVQLRYTWAIDESVTEVKSGDKYGVLKVNNAGSDVLNLWNEDSSISLSKDSTADIMGNLKFAVADSDTARFYPKVDYEITSGGAGTATATAGAPGATVTATALTNVTGVATTPVTAVTSATTVETAKPPTATATPKEPGFEVTLAVTGLLAVAFLVLRQRK